MTENSLYPACAVVSYHSLYGAHKMTLPTTAWNAGIGTNGYGGFLGNDGSTPNDALDVLTELLTLLAEFMPATSSFDAATIYTFAEPGANAEPHAIVPLGIDGTGVAVTQTKAVQQTWNCRSTSFGQFRLVLLDGFSSSDWAKLYPTDFGADDLAIIGSLTDSVNPWVARDTSPIGQAISKTFTLNDKLRRAYGMS